MSGHVRRAPTAYGHPRNMRGTGSPRTTAKRGQPSAYKVNGGPFAAVQKHPAGVGAPRLCVDGRRRTGANETRIETGVSRQGAAGKPTRWVCAGLKLTPVIHQPR